MVLNLDLAEPLVPPELEDQPDLSQIPEPQSIGSHVEADALKLSPPRLGSALQVVPSPTDHLQG
jgi:hypothetical protein